MSGRVLSTVVIAGIALGIAARLVDGIAPRWVGDIGAVWVLAAFWAGSRTDEARRGVFSGVVCLVLACSSYYLWRMWAEDWMWVRFLMTVGTFWLVSSVAVGAGAGYLGARSRRAPEGWAVVAGAFLGEAAAVWLLSGRSTQVGLELLIGVAVIAAVGIRSKRLVALTVAATLMIGVLGVTYRLGLGMRRAMRSYGYTLD